MASAPASAAWSASSTDVMPQILTRNIKWSRFRAGQGINGRVQWIISPAARIIRGGETTGGRCPSIPQEASMNLHRASQAAQWAVAAAVVELHAFIHVQSQEQPAAWWLQAAADVQPLVVTTLPAAWIVLGPGSSLVRVIAAQWLLLT